MQSLRPLYKRHKVWPNFYNRHSVSALFISVLLIVGWPVYAESDRVDSNGAKEDWQFKSELYLWAATTKAELATGDDIEIGFDDVIKNLDFAFMGVFEAQKGKWSIIPNIVHVNLSADDGGDTTIPVGPFMVPTEVDIEVDLKAWVVDLAGGYTLFKSDKSEFQILTGVRYLNLDVSADLDTSIIPDSKIVDGKEDTWDAIAGVRGMTTLSNQWWLNYRFDIGAGDSDLTWNAFAQVGHKYDWGNLVFGYRYLHYNFDSDFKLLKELDIHGPVVGYAWEF